MESLMVLLTLSSSLSCLYDASSEIEKCLDDLEFNPQELESTEERLFAIGLWRASIMFSWTIYWTFQKVFHGN